MASDVTICNVALRKTGSERIASLTQGSKNANSCNDLYASYRDDLLRKHPWNFAMARVKLARETAAPAFGYDYQYTLPADHLRTVQVSNNDAGVGTVDHQEEEGRIRTSAEDVYLRYVRRVTDANEMPPDFQEALACKMAVTQAVDLTDSRTLSEQIAGEARIALITAKSTDALSNQPERRRVGSWVTSRSGLRGTRWAR
jgi:hypothetical protein